MNNHRSAIFLLLLTALLWSTGGFLIKLVVWHPMAIAGGRSAIATIVLWVFLKKPQFNWSAIQITGALCYAATVILFVLANKMTTAANAILLQYTGPIYVALLSSWLLKERITKIDWLSIITAMFGMALFFLDSLSSEGMLGNIIAIAAGIAFAGLAISLRKQKEGSPTESILLGNILTAIIGIPFMIDSGLPNNESIIGIVLLGTIQLGLPYILYAKAIKHVTALESVLIPVLEPLLNPLWVFMTHGEKPGTWANIGGAIVLIAILGRSVLQKGLKK